MNKNYHGIENLKEILKKVRQIFVPKENLTVAECVGKYRHVTRDESVRPGLWDNNLAPFAVEIMDSFTEHEVNQISMMGSAQVVKTEIIKNIIFYSIANDPQKILLLYPTEDAARSFSKEKLEPMLNQNPKLAGKISAPKSRDSSNRTLYKKFIGGSLSMVGSNSPTSLAQRSVKIVISDDVDRIPQSAGDEGDPVVLAEERTESYTLFGYKHARFSTPTIKDFSRIERLYLQSDRRQFYVPCPFCGSEQTLIWENLRWEKKEERNLFDVIETIHLPHTAKYECKNCKKLIPENHKSWMLNNGKWIAEKPEIKKHRGYWINRLYSPFSAWENIVTKFLQSKDDPQTLKTFYNTSLARTWEELDSESIEDKTLLKRVENYMTADNPFIPNGVLVLTSFIDVQGDRLECLVSGFGVKEEWWVIAREVFYGEIERDQVWEDAFNFVWETIFTREDETELSVKRLFIDNSAYTKRVNQVIYDRRKGMVDGEIEKLDITDRRNFGLWGAKGKGGAGRPLIPKTLTASMGGRLRTLVTGVDEGKTSLFQRLNIWDKNRKSGAKVIHFSKEFCDIDFFEQLTAEKKVQKWSSRGPQMYWVKKKSGQANEVLDMMVGCLAALEHLNPNFEKIKENIEAKKEAEQKKKEEKKQTTPTRRRIIRNSFINNY